MKSIIAGIAVSAAMIAGAANAATIYATDAKIVVDGARGTANGRNNIANALGETTGNFFELGLGATVDFTFGQNFTGAGNVVEVTFGTVSNQPESAAIFVGRGGSFTQVATVKNVDAQLAGGGFNFGFNGIFDTLRLIDTTVTSARNGGFDVDRISVQSISEVAPVPLPAAGLLLIGALGGLGAMRRRKTA